MMYEKVWYMSVQFPDFTVRPEWWRALTDVSDQRVLGAMERAIVPRQRSTAGLSTEDYRFENEKKYQSVKNKTSELNRPCLLLIFVCVAAQGYVSLTQNL